MQAEEKEFRDLVYRHRDMLWRICSSYRLAAAWETGDAFHEVLCALWLGLGSFDHRCKEKTWVYRVAVNTMNSLARKKGNQPSPILEEYPDLPFQDDGFRELVQIINTLEEPDHTIVCAHIEGFGYAEIAQITGMKVGAVSMRLTRALRKIRELYNQA